MHGKISQVILKSDEQLRYGARTTGSNLFLIILASILYKFSPRDLRLILIDLKC